MGTMKVISRRDAMAIKHQCSEPSVSRFDLGKYEWKGTQNTFIGKEVPQFPGVLAVYVERRQDNEGPYGQLLSIKESQ